MPALTPAYGYGLGPVDDFFGLAASNLKLVKSTKNPHPKSVAKAQDESGNELAETKYGTDTIFDVTCVYDLISGTYDTADLKLGKYDEGGVGVAPLYESIADGVDVKTDNKTHPQTTVKGATILTASPAGVSSLFNDAEGDLPTFTMPSFVLKGAKIAQYLGCSIATGARISASSLSLSGKIDWHTETGETLAGALTGAELKASATPVEISAAPVFTAATPFAAGDVIQKPGRDATAIDYASGGTWEASKTYPPDVVP